MPRRSTTALLALAALLPCGCTGGEGPTATEPVDLADAWTVPELDVDLPLWEQETSQVWSIQGQPTIFSSPRVMDVDGDGVGDLIMGQGREFDEDAMGPIGFVVALSGVDGSELWRTPTRDEPVGSAVLIPIDDDGVDDVVIGGRNAEMVALSGATGEVIWQFYPDGGAKEDGYYNFYTPQALSDLDGDGVQELLAANGGDASARSGQPQPPGVLMILSGADGTVDAVAEMPDGQPTYMSPLLYDRGGEQTILFGSGGETLPGKLWAAPLSALVQGDLSGAEALIEPDKDKGIIAPPSLADLTGDGTLDVVANMFDGRIVALDGLSGDVLWEVPFENAETYASPVIGYFDADDDVPDVFCGFSIGTWPAYRRGQYALVDGATGEVRFFDDRENFTITSSPLAVDLTGDGVDEIVVLLARQFTFSQLAIFDPTDPAGPRRVTYIPGGGLASPWLGDLDGDGSLDVVFSASRLTPMWTLERWDLMAPAPETIRWGAYLGTEHDGRMVDGP